MTDEAPVKLTQKQEKFCLEYVHGEKSGNATEAYRRSYSAARMKDATIANRAYELLKRGDIKARVAQLMNGREKIYEVSREDHLQKMVELAYCDVGDFFDEKGHFKELKDIPARARRCIGGLKFETVMVPVDADGNICHREDERYVGMAAKSYIADLKLRPKDTQMTNVARYVGLLDKQENTGLHLTISHELEGV